MFYCVFRFHTPSLKLASATSGGHVPSNHPIVPDGHRAQGTKWRIGSNVSLSSLSTGIATPISCGVLIDACYKRWLKIAHTSNHATKLSLRISESPEVQRRTWSSSPSNSMSVVRKVVHPPLIASDLFTTVIEAILGGNRISLCD